MGSRPTNRTERLIQMEQLLFRSSSGLRAVELAEACGVDRRTVYRDVSLLTEVGVPIYQRDGRFHLEREQYLATIRLSFDETVALMLAASMSRQYNPHLASAVAKLSRALPEPIAAHADVLTELTQPSTADAARVEILDTITRAWAQERSIRLWYRTRETGKPSEREVRVYFVEWKPNGATYVVGYDTQTRRVRAFKLSRIQQVEMLYSTYRMPVQFDIKRYLTYLRGTPRTRAGYPDDQLA